jgi:hypothetical protein
VLGFNTRVTGDAQRDQVLRSVGAALGSRYEVMGSQPLNIAALDAKTVALDDESG